MFYIFNTKVLDRDYTELSVPLKKLVPLSNYGLDEQFYGGRVQMIGEVKDSPVLLLIDKETDGLQVVDVATHKLEDINISTLKQYAKNRGIKFEWKSTTKEEIIELLEKVMVKVA